MAVLTDINMPVMNGYELAQALRARDRHLPILAITATALSSERERCRAAGITDILLKPMSLATLDAMLARHASIATAPQVPAPDADLPAPGARTPFPAKLLRLFVDTGRQDLALLADAAQTGNTARAAERLHAFKGVLQMLGERVMAQRCGSFERQLPLAAGGTFDPELQRLIIDLGAMLDDYASRLD